MNHIPSTNRHPTSRLQCPNREGGEQLLRSGVRREVWRRIKQLARWIATFALLLVPWAPVQGGLLKPDVDYSHYDTPLYDQVVNRIKAKVLIRLQKGNNTIDRYFIVPFAYQNKGNDPEFSHSFISVIHVLAIGKHASPEGEFRHGKSHGREFEAFTISWLPHDFDTNPNLCVFDGFGSRIFPSINKCPISPGKSFSLEQTLKMAVHARTAVGMWGPYECKQGAFELGVRRKHLLDRGTIRYRADDRLYRKDQIAINCFHAIADLEDLYPNGGFLGTGFRMWGINGTARVLVEYTKKESNRALLLEPVDIKQDLYGFVYAPEKDGLFVYNPFRNASAYHH